MGAEEAVMLWKLRSAAGVERLKAIPFFLSSAVMEHIPYQGRGL